MKQKLAIKVLIVKLVKVMLTNRKGVRTIKAIR
jgi:hypothetical protein